MPGQTNGRNWDFCQPTNRVSVLIVTGKCFVLNITPGSIMADIPSPNNGLAAIVAAQWPTLEVFLNPSAWHTHFCFWAHALWLWRQLHLPPWLLEYHCALVWIRLDHQQSKGLSMKSYETPTTSLTPPFRKGDFPFPPWGPQGSRHRTTLRLVVWGLPHCLWPNWVTLSNFLHPSMSHFCHL